MMLVRQHNLGQVRERCGGRHLLRRGGERDQAAAVSTRRVNPAENCSNPPVTPRTAENVRCTHAKRARKIARKKARLERSWSGGLFRRGRARSRCRGARTPPLRAQRHRAHGAQHLHAHSHTLTCHQERVRPGRRWQQQRDDRRGRVDFSRSDRLADKTRKSDLCTPTHAVVCAVQRLAWRVYWHVYHGPKSIWGLGRPAKMRQKWGLGRGAHRSETHF
jgi:hypothetical protein